MEEEDAVPILKKAIERLDDQAALTEIIKKYSVLHSSFAMELCLAAVRKSTDQKTLAGFAINSLHTEIHEAAVSRLDDQNSLAEVVQKYRWISGEGIRLAALEKITDQKLLSGFARDDRDKSIRLAAIRKSTDQDLLFNLAKSVRYDSDEKDREIGVAAAGRLTDKKLLAEIIWNEGVHWPVQVAAAKNVTDQALLERLAEEEADDVYKIAVARITDAQVLLRLAKGKDAPAKINVGYDGEAMERLDQLAPELVAGLARDADIAAGIRMNAIWKLTDKKLLEELAGSAPDAAVRKCAAAKLSAPPAKTEPENILDLIKEGKIWVESRGSGIENVWVLFKRMTPYPLEVAIPAGTYFVCANSEAQNMVATFNDRVSLTEDVRRLLHFVPVACANMWKDIPKGKDRFTLAPLPDDGDFKKLMAALGGKHVRFEPRQAAVWIVTDDSDYWGFGRLRRGVNGVGRAIEGADAAEAMRICAGAGIDIKNKRIWGTRNDILNELEDGELKNWLEDFVKP
ncbi:MAG: hypothetical protein LBC18_01265 [Opitutaceae bacterium]|nr:hypothetical protein [Opitutaceae bacterium]